MLKRSTVIKRVTYWSRLLNLRMWKITVEFKEPDEISESMRGPGNVACIWHRDCLYEADLWLSAEYLKEDTITEDLDNSIVHELLHLVWTDADDNRLQHSWHKKVMLERVINQIAETIVKLERKK